MPVEPAVPGRPLDACALELACVRCGVIEARDGRHVWGRWITLGDSQVRSCRVCGADDELTLPPPTVACPDCDGTGHSSCPGCDEWGICTVADPFAGTDDVIGYRDRGVPCVLDRGGPRRARWCPTCGGTGTMQSP